MRSKKHTSHRLISTVQRILTGLSVVFLLILAVACYRVFSLTLPLRTNIVFVTDPITVVSFEHSEQTVTHAHLDPDTIIQMTHGYGEYSLESTWELGVIENNISLLPQSLQEVLATPIQYVVGKSEQDAGSEVDIDTFFSIAGLVSNIAGQISTTISPEMHARLIFINSGIDIIDQDSITLTNETLLQEREQADGSVAQVFDQGRLDVMLQSLFELRLIREEGMTIAVYNTTNTPRLGWRAGRLLARSGMHVVLVENDTESLDICRITTSVEHEKTESVRYIRSVYGCELDLVDDILRADIELRIGKQYESYVTGGS